MATSLSLLFFKGPYISEHFILGKLGNIQSQEKMGDVFRRAHHNENKDLKKANTWYINAVDYWHKNKSDISLADKKTVLRMLAKMDHFHLHNSGGYEHMMEKTNIYLTMAEIMPIPERHLNFLWEHRNITIYPDTLTKVEFENKIYATPRDKDWFRGYTTTRRSPYKGFATKSSQPKYTSMEESTHRHKKPFFKIVETCWQLHKRYAKTNITLVCVD